MDAGAVGSMRKLGITESYKLKRQVVVSASEAAEMIIRYVFHLRVPSTYADLTCRVDNILRSTPRRREGQ